MEEEILQCCKAEERRLINKMENKNQAPQGVKVYENKNLGEREFYHHYDDFFDRFKTWEQIRAERYLC